MSNAITQRQNGAANVIEQVIIEGDLARLTPEQRVKLQQIKDRDHRDPRKRP